MCHYPSLDAPQYVINGMIPLNGLMHSRMWHLSWSLDGAILFIIMVMIDWRINTMVLWRVVFTSLLIVELSLDLLIVSTIFMRMILCTIWSSILIISCCGSFTMFIGWNMMSGWIMINMYNSVFILNFDGIYFTNSKFLDSLCGASSLSIISTLICSFWEPSVSSKVTSTAISIKLVVLLKTRYHVH